MSHGGSREGSGRPPIYSDDEGNPLPTKSMRVPECLTKQDLERLAREKLKKQQNDNKN